MGVPEGRHAAISFMTIRQIRAHRTFQEGGSRGVIRARPSEGGFPSRYTPEIPVSHPPPAAAHSGRQGPGTRGGHSLIDTEAAKGHPHDRASSPRRTAIRREASFDPVLPCMTRWLSMSTASPSFQSMYSETDCEAA